MALSRRDLLARGASVAAAGIAGASLACAAEGESKGIQHMVAACGLACTTCPLMKEGKCKGCASGKDASAEMVEKKGCPVLKCASMKKIDYCGTGCKMFADCQKLVGRPYDKEFLAMVKKRLA